MSNASTSHTTIRARIDRVVRIDETHIEKAISWLLDSAHQHMDNISVGIGSGIAAAFFGRQIPDVVVMAGVVVAILIATRALYVAKHHVHRVGALLRVRGYHPTPTERAFDEGLLRMVEQAPREE